MPPQINMNELHTMQKKKEKIRSIAYDHIIELIHRRIKMVASFGATNTFYEIPGLVIGYPLYNLIDCTNYIIKALRNNGMLVQLLPPPHISVIYLSWDKKDIKAIAPPPDRPAIMPPSKSFYGSYNIQPTGRHTNKKPKDDILKQLRLF